MTSLRPSLVAAAALLPLLALVACQPAASSSADAGEDLVESDGGTLTWYRDVMPITNARCAGCHAQQGVAPFAMATYDDVKNWHASMAGSVQGGRMPPWMPSEQCLTIKDTRRLQKWERDTLITWSRQGGQAGDPADAPTATVVRPELPWVDVTLQPSASYTPNATVDDDYHCFVLDPKLTADKDLVGYEILPGERKTVHHVILYGATAAEASAKNSGGAGWTCYGGPEVANPVMLGGWVPGTFITRLPETTGITLKAGSLIVMQVHYNLGAGALPDRTTAKLQFAKARVAKPAIIIPQAKLDFLIPPNAKDYSAAQRDGIIPLAKTLWGVLPHMHTKGVSIDVKMKTSPNQADSAATCLIDIPRWDFHWQQLYFYDQPLSLPAGGEVKLTCRWQNPTNKRVTWGEGTDDEMCLNYYYVTQ